MFVVDDTGENAGTITSGWNLDIKTSVNACLFSLDPTAASFPNTGGAGDFDVTIPADYDADGKTDYAVYRAGVWYIQRSTDGVFAAQFGLADDIPVTGDYDGNGIADLAVYRDGIWYQILNLQTFSAFRFGLAEDIPVPADYDGDGKFDAAVFRQGIWYILRSSDAQFLALQFGLANDQPIPNAFVP